MSLELLEPISPELAQSSTRTLIKPNHPVRFQSSLSIDGCEGLRCKEGLVLIDQIFLHLGSFELVNIFIEILKEPYSKRSLRPAFPPILVTLGILSRLIAHQRLEVNKLPGDTHPFHEVVVNLQTRPRLLGNFHHGCHPSAESSLLSPLTMVTSQMSTAVFSAILSKVLMMSSASYWLIRSECSALQHFLIKGKGSRNSSGVLARPAL